MKYVVFGDTGGHFKQLFNGLKNIGMSDDYFLPKDITIIHCGDLVHKGPDSEYIVQLVNTIKQKNPGQWVQIIGNHEAQYLGGIVFRQVGLLGPESEGIINEWYEEGFLRFTYVIPQGHTIHTVRASYASSTPILVSHAGVSYPFYDAYLKNKNVKDYNSVLRQMDIPLVHRAGLMMGEVYDAQAPIGPVWAHGIHENWVLWEQQDTIPFSQIIGHINPYVFNGTNAFFPGTPEYFTQVADIHPQESVTVAPLREDFSSWILYTDPGYDSSSYHHTQPTIFIRD